MEWYNYIACFFSGVFLANAMPHFVYGVCGNKFPTPFAKPPGKGLSSPPLNVVWALFNLIIGFLLFNAGHISYNNCLTWVLFFVGVTVMSLMLSFGFQKKHKE